MTDQGVTPLTGCGCGQVHLPSKQDTWVDGVLHRYSAPCFRQGPDGKREYYDIKNHFSLADRVAALEKVVADLIARSAK